MTSVLPLLHRQVFQNRLDIGPVGGVLAYVGPDDVAGCIDDEDGGGGDAVTEQVVDTISLGHGVVGVGQDGEGGLGHMGHQLGSDQVVRGHGDDLGVTRLKLLVIVLQIDDLLAAGASGLPPIKDEQHICPALIVAQCDRPPLSALQGKVGGWLRGHRLSYARRRFGLRRGRAWKR